jgi:hypothetical protein
MIVPDKLLAEHALRIKRDATSQVGRTADSEL